MLFDVDAMCSIPRIADVHESMSVDRPNSSDAFAKPERHCFEPLHSPTIKLTCIDIRIYAMDDRSALMLGLTAIATQHRLTYGLSRSPILAARQKVPRGLRESQPQKRKTLCLGGIPSLVSV